MNPINEYALQETRRYFLGRAATGVGTAALASLLNPRLLGADSAAADPQASLGQLPKLHHAPKAKRVIWLFMADGPSQLDLWDYKPGLSEYFDKDLPDSVRMGQRITTMTSGQTRLPVAPSKFAFQQHGQNGTWVSELLPHLGGVVDDLCLIKTMNTEAINHDPAITYIQTGSQIPGRPSLGSWLSYGTRCGRSAIRCCTCRIPTASIKPRAGRCSTASPSSIKGGSKNKAIPKSLPGSPNTKWHSGCRCRSRS